MRVSTPRHRSARASRSRGAEGGVLLLLLLYFICHITPLSPVLVIHSRRILLYITTRRASFPDGFLYSVLRPVVISLLACWSAVDFFQTMPFLYFNIVLLIITPWCCRHVIYYAAREFLFMKEKIILSLNSEFQCCCDEMEISTVFPIVIFNYLNGEKKTNAK